MQPIGILGIILALAFGLWGGFFSDLSNGIKALIVAGCLVLILVIASSSNGNNDLSSERADSTNPKEDSDVVTDDAASAIKTVYLSDLNPYHQGYDKNYSHSSISPHIYSWTLGDKDNMGNTYINGYHIEFYDMGRDDEEFVVFRTYEIKEQYSSIEGKFVLHEDGKRIASDESYAVLVIFADDYEVHRTEFIGQGVKPIPFSANIANATDIKIEVHMVGDTKVGVVDVILTP